MPENYPTLYITLVPHETNFIGNSIEGKQGTVQHGILGRIPHLGHKALIDNSTSQGNSVAFFPKYTNTHRIALIGLLNASHHLDNLTKTIALIGLFETSFKCKT